MSAAVSVPSRRSHRTGSQERETDLYHSTAVRDTWSGDGRSAGRLSLREEEER